MELTDPYAIISIRNPHESTGGAALLLRHTQNLSVEEIAALTNVPNDTAKKRLQRALTKLRKYFADRGLLAAATLALVALAPAPTSPALAATITATALSPLTAAKTTVYLIAKGVTHMMNLAKFVKTAVIALVLGISLLSSILMLKAAAPPARASNRPAPNVSSSTLIETTIAPAPTPIPATQLPAIKSAILARLDQLKNIYVEYTEEQNHTPPLTMRPAPGSVLVLPGSNGGAATILPPGARPRDPTALTLGSPKQGIYGYNNSLSYLNDGSPHLRVDARPDAATIQKITLLNEGDHHRYLQIFNLASVESLTERPERGPRGDTSKDGETHLEFFDLALGLRIDIRREFLHSTWLYQHLDSLTYTRSPDGLIVATLAQPNATLSLSFDPRRNFVLTRYILTSPNSAANSELFVTDFKDFQGTLLPFSASLVFRNPLPNGNLEPVRTITWKVSQYALNDPKNAADRYKMQWPEGSIILDNDWKAPSPVPAHTIIRNGVALPLTGNEYLKIEAQERARAITPEASLP